MKRPPKPFAVEIKGQRRNRPATTDLRSEPIQEANPEPIRPRHQPGYEEAMRAADAVFGKTLSPIVESESTTPTHHDGGRILVALNEVDPLQERIIEAENRRRGRPPKAATLTVERRVRPKKQPARAITVPAPQAPPPPQLSAVVFRRSSRRIREKWVTRTVLAPGERWKRRLPKAAW